MRQTLIALATTAAASMLATTSVQANDDLSNVCPNPIRMADTGIEGMGPLEEAFGPFAETFEETTGLELEMFSLSNRTAAGNALQYDDVDLVFGGPSEFVLFEREGDIEILFAIERPHYGSSFFVPADSDIKSLEDLEGKRVALKDTGSTSGHIFPSKMLVDAGLDLERDMEIIMAGDARIAALVNGDVDAMGGGNRDIEEIEAMDPEGEYRVIAESDVLPGDPVIMRGSLAEECKTALRDTLEANADELWDALISTERNEDKFLNRDSSMGFGRTSEDYEVIREAYEAAGIDL
ncbi:MULTISPECIES: phosphate/phosphite/phosphonate ABC transporter substrate-binding protein [unclassified Halomonas]|uniref:phosphate/phosphite/phosphonate ABC transporter substrate-binding protein n=1 Tax=unclassified Halomonas TaxID=2609666 RepID=UPI0006DB815F|nr:MULTISPECIES: phosphate/phosphite/phosphonate ABC transporter substrate-binding protein [unclassified Halomonas]KPQ21640.1 MAG: ABC-type phosphate/phosphonate transport system, periplasmic component [Halomonas sp. HL-93]SBR46677.1 phosphonate transport system substrate-binding protein [Halomonas sp. HL-93]SNY98862.1 phosphonate transport system substrate-binding protein [Halomonas sp. hl-4]